MDLGNRYLSVCHMTNAKLAITLEGNLDHGVCQTLFDGRPRILAGGLVGGSPNSSPNKRNGTALIFFFSSRGDESSGQFSEFHVHSYHQKGAHAVLPMAKTALRAKQLDSNVRD